MGVEPGGCKTHRSCLAVAGDIEVAGPRRIDRYEYIRNYAASAIYYSAGFGSILEIPVHLNAVGIGHLAVHVTVVDVIVIILAVRFLYAAAGRSVETGYGKTYSRAVGEVDRFLD